MPDQLLFINKDQSSVKLSRSESKERARILSHVQSKRRSAEAHQAASQRPQTTYTYRAKTSRTVIDNQRQSKAIPVAPVTLVTVFPVNNSIDPFNSAAVPMDANMYGLLRLVFAEAARPNILAEAFAPSHICGQAEIKTRHDRIIERRLQSCIDNPSLMYSTLAYGSSLLRWTHNKAIDEQHSLMKEPATTPRGLIAQAVQHIRATLTFQSHNAQKDKVNDWLLLSIYSLAIAEMWDGSPRIWSDLTNHEQYRDIKPAKPTDTQKTSIQASRTHLKALVDIVKATVIGESNGWDMFDPYILDSAVLADKFLSVSTSEPPLIPLNWDPGSFPPGQERASLSVTLGHVPGMNHAQDRLGSTFQHLPISPGINTLVQDVVEYCEIAEILWASGSTINIQKATEKVAMSTATETWLSRRLQALLHRLLMTIYTKGAAEATQIDQYICLGISIFLFTCTSGKGPMLAAYDLVRHLCRNHLELLSLSGMKAIVDDEDYSLSWRLEIWTMATAAMVPIKSPEVDLCAARLVSLFGSKPGKELVQEHLQSFLYIPPRQDELLNDLTKRISRL